MKKPLSLWILLSAGVVWLNVQDVHGVRASALIFAKSSTTTTTTTTPASSEESSEEESDTTEPSAELKGNATKPVLTGIPQIDYIYDPNLPKELNGYNLSDYPFYERVPENMTFKCDGLHDGFYASVPHKCQVYHHCLFGVRYDFLCANYTAFDQTLFNCNFVSNVDCENSKKFWNRNDDLYVAKTTTPPPVVYSFYTQSPPSYAPSGAGVPPRRNPLLRRIPQQNIIPVQVQPVPGPTQTGNVQPFEVNPESAVIIPIESSLPLEPRRRPRPPARVRPYYDYYDEYDELPRYRRKRPRPYYDDDYEYYDDIYERRGEGRRRRPSHDRPMRRYKSRRDRYEDDDEDVAYDDYDRDDEREIGKRKGNKNGNRNNSKRQPPRRQYSGKPKRPVEEEYDDEYEDEPVTRKIKPETSRNQNRRPLPRDENEQISRKNRKPNSSEIPLDETKVIIKPTSGTIFDRPRVAPKINLPVPKNVADKYSYTAMSAKGKDIVDDSSEEEETENTETVTTMRGNFKRPYLTRKQPNSQSSEKTTQKSSNRKQSVQTDESDESEEIQERKANSRQTMVRMKNPAKTSTEEIPKIDTKRQDGQERRGVLTRVNMYKTRHSLSTPDTINEEYSDDLTEIDESLNEA